MVGCLLSMRDGEIYSQCKNTPLNMNVPRYGNYLYSSGLLDANQRDECLAIEEEFQNLIKEGNL